MCAQKKTAGRLLLQLPLPQCRGQLHGTQQPWRYLLGKTHHLSGCHNKYETLVYMTSVFVQNAILKAEISR